MEKTLVEIFEEGRRHPIRDYLPSEDEKPPAKAGNLQHREDFNSLLDAAVAGKKLDQ